MTDIQSDPILDAADRLNQLSTDIAMVTAATRQAVQARDAAIADADAARAAEADARQALTAADVVNDTLRAQLGDVTARALSAERRVQEADGVIVAANARIGALTAEIARLEAIIAEDPDLPPMSVNPFGKFVIGAATTGRPATATSPATTAVQEWQRWETELGRPSQIRRTFDSGFPLTATGSAMAKTDSDFGKRHRFWSFKGTPTRAQIVSFLRSIPKDGFVTVVARNHEPENDGGIMTPAVFDQRNAELLSCVREVRAEGRTDIWPGFVLMTWLERDGKPDTSSQPWFPADPAEWILGVDPYDAPNSNYPDPGDLVLEHLRLWRAEGGRYWMVTETGTHRPGLEGAVWIAESLLYCKADPHCFGWMYFASAVGDNASANGWYLTDPRQYKAIRDQMV